MINIMQYKTEFKTYQTLATSDHAQSLSTLLLISYLEFTEKKLTKSPASSNSSTTPGRPGLGFGDSSGNHRW